jgi:hypothetical protein
LSVQRYRTSKGNKDQPSYPRKSDLHGRANLSLQSVYVAIRHRRKTGLKDFKLPIEPVGSTQAPPLFEKLSVMVGTMDTFLNNQSLGVKKNSFQFTNGITYTME